MAKYTINHTCGHKTEVNLVGPHKERDRKIEWLEGQDCWKCRRDAEFAAAQADTTPVSATLRPRLSIDESQVGIVALFEGGTYQRKDDLKAAGAIYAEPGDMGGIFGLLGTSRPAKSWHIAKALSATQVAEIMAGVKAGSITAKNIWRKIGDMIGVPEDIEIKSVPEAGDLHLLARALDSASKAAAAATAEETKRDAWLKDNPKPAVVRLRDVVDIEFERWNGKIYGGGRVYLDGDEHTLTPDQVAKIENSAKELADWKAAATAADIKI